MKVILSIIQVQDECRVVVGIEAVPRIVFDKKIIYQDIQEAENSSEARSVIERMKEKAKEWARENGILFVFNLDLDSYP